MANGLIQPVNSIYKKYVYWLTGEEEEALRNELESQGTRLRTVKGVVCFPLNKSTKIASVPPEVWDQTCARQGSWYRASEKNGLYLIVSNFALDDTLYPAAALLTLSSFKPPILANLDEKRDLIEDPYFQSKIPAHWKTVDEKEKKIYLMWAKKLGSSLDDYDFLYLTQTANHANFINPRFFIREKGLTIPYSLDVSAHLCSCCLELFLVIGGSYSKKLVAPCPGATIFAELEPNRYILVQKG
jgi:hypothetical protein